MLIQNKKIRTRAIAAGVGVCLIAGVGISAWNLHDKENESQMVSDEVAEIETLNSRDNVVDSEDLFEEETVSWKEKKELSEQQSQSGTEDSKKPVSSKDSSKTEGQPSTQEGQTEKPGNQPSEPEEQPGQPSSPEEKPETPEEKPALPQVNDPGWIMGIY